MYGLYTPSPLLQTFGREEHLEGGEPEVRVRVNNTQLGLVSYWDLGKFESRLEQMRDVYQVGQRGGGCGGGRYFNSIMNTIYRISSNTCREKYSSRYNRRRGDNSIAL